MPAASNAPSPNATRAALQFVQLWMGGDRPALEDFLRRVEPAEQPTLFESLLMAEVNARKHRQETPDSREYLHRFPQYQSTIVQLLGQPKTISAPVPTAVPLSSAPVPVAPLPLGVSIMPVATAMYPQDHRPNAFAFGEHDPSPAPRPAPMATWEEKETSKLMWWIGFGFLFILLAGGATAYALLPGFRQQPTVVEEPVDVVPTPASETPPTLSTKVESKDFDMGGPKSTGDIERDLVDWLREMGASGNVLTEQGGRVKFVGGQNMPKLTKFVIEAINFDPTIANRWNNRSIARLSELKGLKKLDLAKDKDLSDDTLTPLVSTAKLKSLELRGLQLQITGEGVARFPELENLVINTAPAFNDADCAALVKLQQLQSIELNGTKIGVNGFKQLSNLPNLKKFTFGNDLTLSPDHIRTLQTAPLEEVRSSNGFSDEIFAEFASFPKIKRYSLHKTTISATGFKAVAGQVNLEEITIVNSNLTSDALKHLSELTALTTLDLSGGKIEGDGLKSLTMLPDLKHVRLAGNPLTDNDIALLAPLESMETLDISNTKITDGALGALKKHQKLKQLIIRGTQVTPGGIKDFKMGTPQCQVVK